MGVPKLFRWMVERYPLVLRPSDTFPAPQFDNFYLDFNGVIHMCTHRGDDEELSSKTDKEVMFSIFAYIEVLFNIVKPKKLLMIAIDGVAPRAKMNAQRQRRFKTIYNRLRKNETLKEGAWDSNSITPGTQFLAELTNELKFFIQHKLNSDPEWKNIKIILSGPEVPGEGEHKIAEFIRHQKGLADYDPTTTHCLYGLDADLIMLSLATHEPYFTLLREKVVFKTKREREAELNKKAEISIQKTDSYQFFSVTLLREYLEIEFKNTKSTLEQSLERLIDDFVFLCFLVGNDFLPSIPFLEIDDGGLETLFSAYKELLPTLKAYLVNAETSKINLEALVQLFGILTRKERTVFKKTIEEAQAKAEKEENAAKPKEETKKEESKPIEEAKEEIKEEKKEEKKEEIKLPVIPPSTADIPDSGFISGILNKMTKQKELNQIESSLKSLLGMPAQTAETKKPEVRKVLEITEATLSDFKKRYQINKLLKQDVTELTEEFYTAMCHNYIEGLVWNLSYYYQGHLSWKWFYAYHVAPFVSDLHNVKNFANLKLNFDIGKPFSPLQQLLAVLPPQSKHLVPAALQDLMTSPNSPIIDFFPTKFDFLADERNREWKNVALIPFIDEARLLKAFEAVDEKQLSAEEKKRNSFGGTFVFTFSKEGTGGFFKSVYSEEKPRDKKAVNHCKWEPLSFALSEVPVGNEKQEQQPARKKFKPLPHQNFKPANVIPPKGFPTLRTLPFDHQIDKVGVNVVGSASRVETMVLKMTQTVRDDLATFAQRWVGKKCVVDWPYHTEAQVAAISTPTQYLHLSNRGKVAVTETPANSIPWPDLVAKLKATQLTSNGIDFAHTIQCVFHVNLFEGMKRTKGSGMKKKFSTQVVQVPYPLVMTSESVSDVVAQDPRFIETFQSMPIDEQFPTGAKVAYGAFQHFGCVGYVLGRNKKDRDLLDVELEVLPTDPQLGHQIAVSMKEKYFKSNEVAQMFNISTLALSRITGTLNVKPGEVDLGIGVKYSSRDLVIPGYARKVILNNERSTFEYSEKAVKLLQQYYEAFPEFFAGINKDPKQDVFDGQVIFGEKCAEKMAECLKFLSNSPVAKLPLVPCDSNSLSNECILAIEESAIKFVSEGFFKKKTKKTLTVNVEEVINPSFPIEFGHVHTSKFELGDRVVYIGNTGPVPFGMRGTAITMQGETVEVLFDEEFLSGTTLQGRIKTLRGGTVQIGNLLNITHPYITYVPTKEKQDAKAKTKGNTKVSTNPFDLLSDE